VSDTGVTQYYLGVALSSLAAERSPCCTLLLLHSAKITSQHLHQLFVDGTTGNGLLAAGWH
jgi:hypothetical protein